MPVKSVQDRAMRPPVVGKIRTGIYRGGRPRATKNWVFSVPDRYYLEPIAKAYGGSPEEFTPQGQTEQQWLLFTESSEIVVLLPFWQTGLNLEQWRELYGSGHIKRRCDEEDALVYTVDDATGAVTMEPTPCVCVAQDRLECDLVTRLICWIPSAGLGVWEFTTRSKNAAFSIPDEFALLGAQFDGEVNKVPVALTIKPRRTTRWDEKKHQRIPATVLVVSMRLAVPFLEAKASLASGGNPALEAFGHKPALGAGDSREGSTDAEGTAFSADGPPAPRANVPADEPLRDRTGLEEAGETPSPPAPSAGTERGGGAKRKRTRNGEGASATAAPPPHSSEEASGSTIPGSAPSSDPLSEAERGSAEGVGPSPAAKTAPASDPHPFEGEDRHGPCQREGCGWLAEHPDHRGCEVTREAHRFHPDYIAGDPAGAVLYDDCARCDWLAEHPGELDDQALGALVNLFHPKTANDARGLRYVTEAVRLARRASEVTI